MTEEQRYQRTITIERPVDEVFAYVSDVQNLPAYLPPIDEAHHRAPSEGNEQDAAAQGAEGVHLHGSMKGQAFENDGWYQVDQGAHSMTWGAQADGTYSGSLTVTGQDGTSQVEVTLSFGPRSPHDQMEERSGERDLVQEALGASLESIRRQVEGEGGKVTPPEPPGPPPVPTDGPTGKPAGD